ncbi:MAG: DUF3102 domain-containing protein [Proteobacteria bacterium]|nr:DUF3102 domain-containing protein [Pseudomonadota bacterium]
MGDFVALRRSSAIVGNSSTRQQGLNGGLLGRRIVSDLSKLAESIRTNMKRVQVFRLEAGRDLLKAKELLPHGQFLPWLKTEGIPARSAQEYMALAKAADKVQSKLEIKYAEFAHLPAADIKALAKSDDETLKSVEIDGQQPSIEQIVKAVRLPKTAPAPTNVQNEAALKAVQLLNQQLMSHDLAKFRTLVGKAGVTAFAEALFQVQPDQNGKQEAAK